MSIEKYINECKNCTIDKDIKKNQCPVCLTQKLIRGKWKVLIMWNLRKKELRFSELKNTIPKITQAYLSSQLKELESDGLIFRKSYNVVPPRVEYFLTENGKSFIGVIESMNKWGMDSLSNILSPEQIEEFTK